MNKRILFLVILVAIPLVACQSNNPISHSESEDETVSPIDIYDFSFIKHAPDSTKKQKIDDIIKLYFIENDSSLDTGFAVDIENSLVYIDPSVGSRGVRRSNDDPDELNNPKDFIDLVEMHDIQDWKKRYSDAGNHEDGYGWTLLLQYTDGTVEKHAGSGVDMEQIRPNNFLQFKKDLAGVVEKGLVKDEQ